MAISPQRLTIYLYSAHRAVIFAIAQLSCHIGYCFLDPLNGQLSGLRLYNAFNEHHDTNDRKQRPK